MCVSPVVDWLLLSTQLLVPCGVDKKIENLISYLLSKCRASETFVGFVYLIKYMVVLYQYKCDDSSTEKIFNFAQTYHP